MKSKKGLEMATGTVVAIILGLVILIILIVFVQQQVKTTSEKYGKIGEEADISADKCASILQGSFCSDQACDTSKRYKEKIGMWKDCLSPKHCCERPKPL